MGCVLSGSEMPDLSVIKGVGFLSALSDEELRVLLSGARRTRFTKDQHVLAQGHRNASLFVVLAGVLHAVRAGGSKQVFLGRLEPGSFFGELSLFDPGPTAAAVHGLEDGELLEISCEYLDEFIATHPVAGIAILRGILREVAHRLRRADERLADAVVWGGLAPVRRV